MKPFLRKNMIFAIILNIVIIALEIVGLVLSVKRHGAKVFQFYTENSNYLTLIVSLFFVFEGFSALKNNRLLSKWTILLRYVANCCLAITLVVVLFILIPLRPHTLTFMLFKDSNLYQHLLCPIISIFSFLTFENQIKLKKRAILISLLPTFVYGICLIILNLLKVVVGPYPFFYVYLLPLHILLLSIVGVLLISIFLSYLLYRLYNKKIEKSKNSHLKMLKSTEFS